MKEYTILACVSVAASIIADRALGTHILALWRYWFFFAAILGFKFLVNGYLTGTGIVLYNRVFYLGYRIGSIPLEDFLFGFSMVTVSVVLWERFCRD